MISAVKKFIPVMLTPFCENGLVDYHAMPGLVEFYLEAGALGLFANCLSSEMFELTEQERLKVTRMTVEHVNGGVPVIATGTFSGTIQQQADFIKRVYDTGVQSVIIITSFMAGVDEADEILDENIFELINKTESIPLGFYECPVPYKRLLSAQQLQRYVATGRVIYHKDTSLNIENVSEKIKLTKDYNFGLYDAYMVNAVKSLKAGSAGLSCIQGNFFPELVVWLCENYNNPLKENEVAIVQQFFVTKMDVMHELYPIAAKYLLQTKHKINISKFTRREVGSFNNETAGRLDNLFSDYHRLEEEINLR